MGRRWCLSGQQGGTGCAGGLPSTLHTAWPTFSSHCMGLAPCQHLRVSMAWRCGTTGMLGLVGTWSWRQEGSTGWSLSLFLAVSRFVKYTGYGNAAGLLAARGLMAGGREEGEYSEDEDTDTEEYKEAKPK